MTRIVSSYGSTYRTGVISEHAYLADEVRTLAGGRRVAVVVEGRRRVAYPVLCSELVSIPTEDGPMVGRCGDFVSSEGFACEGHADQIRGYYERNGKNFDF